jgi:predicted phosphoribosyltransferase
MVAESTAQASNDSYQEALRLARAHAQKQLATFEPALTHTDPQGAIALIVDDGIATGMTIAAAVQSLRARQPAQIWICAPLAPPDMMPFLRSLSDRLIILETPYPFYSVSRFYGEFPQVTNDEVMLYLQQQASESSDNKKSNT